VLLGTTTAGDIDRKAAGIESVTSGGGFTWGVQAGHFFSPHLGAEVVWARQDSGVDVETVAGEARLFETKVDQVHGHLVYRFGADGARIRPFLLAGVGASVFSADELETETYLALSLGGGVKVGVRPGIALRLQIRYNPTLLNDEDAEPFCDPFGFCQGTLSQGEASAGVVFSF
jgi:opacity protein-like surface antigen